MYILYHLESYFTSQWMVFHIFITVYGSRKHKWYFECTSVSELPLIMDSWWNHDRRNRVHIFFSKNYLPVSWLLRALMAGSVFVPMSKDWFYCNCIGTKTTNTNAKLVDFVFSWTEKRADFHPTTAYRIQWYMSVQWLCTQNNSCSSFTLTVILPARR